MLTIADGRPYPPTGLTTARWIGEVPTSAVRLDALTTTQTHVDIAAVLYREHTGPDPHPNVIAWGGRLYLEDGHGRVVRAILDGHTVWPCRVLRA
jgi:hypothetical protein